MEKIVGEIQPQNKAITDYNANCAPLSTAETVKMARAGWSPRGVLGMPGPRRHSKYCLPQDTNKPPAVSSNNVKRIYQTLYHKILPFKENQVWFLWGENRWKLLKGLWRMRRQGTTSTRNNFDYNSRHQKGPRVYWTHLKSTQNVKIFLGTKTRRDL